MVQVTGSKVAGTCGWSCKRGFCSRLDEAVSRNELHNVARLGSRPKALSPERRRQRGVRRDSVLVLRVLSSMNGHSVQSSFGTTSL